MEVSPRSTGIPQENDPQLEVIQTEAEKGVSESTSDNTTVTKDIVQNSISPITNTEEEDTEGNFT